LVGGTSLRAIRLACASALPFLNRGNQLTLPHASRTRDAHLLGDPLKLGYEQGRKSGAGSAARLGGSAIGRRGTDGGSLGRRRCASEEFGGIAH
jgi:hypothetical protein